MSAKEKYRPYAELLARNEQSISAIILSDPDHKRLSLTIVHDAEDGNDAVLTVNHKPVATYALDVLQGSSSAALRSYPTVNPDEQAALELIRSYAPSGFITGRISLSSGKTYTTVVLDGKNTKMIARLYLRGGRKQIGLFDGKTKRHVHPRNGRAFDVKVENKESINSVADIVRYRDQLAGRIVRLDNSD